MNPSTGKPKIALFWCAGCGGCEESVIDLGASLIDLADEFELVYWPIAIDAKTDALEALEDGELDAAIINGAVRNEEDVFMARLARRKAKKLISHGACAVTGGVLGLANLHSTAGVKGRAYSDKAGARPELAEALTPLSGVVEVDGNIPGCPPTAKQVRATLDSVSGAAPWPVDGVWAEPQNLCGQCPYGGELAGADSLPGVADLSVAGPGSGSANGCFLLRGMLCMGPATRGGCEARCINAAMPCRGCYGPISIGDDMGGATADFLATLCGPGSEIEINDVTGHFYRYTAAISRFAHIGKGRGR